MNWIYAINDSALLQLDDNLNWVVINDEFNRHKKGTKLSMLPYCRMHQFESSENAMTMDDYELRDFIIESAQEFENL